MFLGPEFLHEEPSSVLFIEDTYPYRYAIEKSRYFILFYSTITLRQVKEKRSYM